MVGVLIVSHSKKAAEGIYELAVQMAGKDHRVVAVGGMEDGSIAVSYTHLDVYKRQVYVCLQ